jgi:hypothetical protein
VTGLVAIAALIVVLSLPPALKALIVTERWIARHVAEHHARQDGEQSEFEQIVARLRADYPDLEETVRHLQQTVRPARPASPCHAIKRRRMPGVRIPGRRVRRHTTSTSNSERH